MSNFAVTFPQPMAGSVDAVLAMHPRPWAMVNFNANGEGATYAWVADAQGNCVIGSSEWLNMKAETMALVVLLVNNLAVRE